MAKSSQRLRSSSLGRGLVLALLVSSALAQTELATVFGRIADQSGAVVSGAEVEIRNVSTNDAITVQTNSNGLYSVPSLHPGEYVISVRKPGFRTVSATGLELNVQDNVARNFVLQVGSAAESVTVTAEEAKINMTDATVSTVVDRNFADNLPMNGRSFQTLIQLTPGVVVTPTNSLDNGQFSIAGQRAASNYWTVDGVGANTGIGISLGGIPGNGLAGTVGSYSALGGTNGLVSVDAMQEFRIQTSTYAPEFGRVPGGQISIVTRSGTNVFHGTAFDYVRNDIFDATNWFNGFRNNPPLPKARERQNDFGGTFNGPIFKDRTFFFFSYEGLRLRLPQTSLTTVPDLAARQNAVPAMQPYLDAYPLPNGLDDPSTGIAQFNASYSNAASLDAYSLRLDHRVRNDLSLFARYNYSPSQLVQRGNAGNGGVTVALNVFEPLRFLTQTATMGATWSISSTVINDFRFNYSSTNASSSFKMDKFGGAVPLEVLPIPSPFTSANSEIDFDIFALTNSELTVGKAGHNRQQQINIVDNIALQRGSHSLKIGFDLRRLSPLYDPYTYLQEAFLLDVPSAVNGNNLEAAVGSGSSPRFLFHNLGSYAQDTWRMSSRFTATYGLRWDIDFAPSSQPNFLSITGFHINDLSHIALAPPGTPPFHTTYGNIAPRVGLAYQLSANPQWQTVLRSGIGIFYDLATSEVGNNTFSQVYPYGGQAFIFGGPYPLPPSATVPPQTSLATLARGELFASDPHLRLPYTVEWNLALEQALGTRQTISATYLGSSGRRLMQTAYFPGPVSNPLFASAQFVVNAGNSNYNALQLQFQRRLSRGLQALVSYAWSHSIDTGSAGSTAVVGNAFVPGTNTVGSAYSRVNRGSSDFDVRQAFSAGATYDLPTRTFHNQFTSAVLHGWAVENTVQTRTPLPVDVSDVNFFTFKGAYAAVRPDVVTGQPLYLSGSQYPGGKAFNPAAFTNPPSDPNTGNPLRQGTLPRNALRGFGMFEWECAVHRDFPIRESLHLQFRAESFNVLNHPNFGPPNSQFGAGGFGVSTQLLGQSLAGFGSTGTGAFSPLYQIGGPRSIQFALKLLF
jgi:carboxypeptidase family protein/TonB-dependent receptor-like protein